MSPSFSEKKRRLDSVIFGGGGPPSWAIRYYIIPNDCQRTPVEIVRTPCIFFLLGRRRREVELELPWSRCSISLQLLSFFCPDIRLKCQLSNREKDSVVVGGDGATRTLFCFPSLCYAEINTDSPYALSF